MRRSHLLGVPAAAAVFLSLLVAGPRAVAQEPGAPEAPTDVSARVVEGGVRVSWSPPPSSDPAVTHYVVHAGQGSCPVTVDAKARSAVMPVVKGQRVITPRVQAVNPLGYSSDAAARRSVDVRGHVSSDYVNLQVLELSDFHGALEQTDRNIGAALLATAFERDRRAVPRTVTLSAGDNFGASPAISAQFDEVPAIRALNLMGLQVSTLGNHEHDRPLEHLRRMVGASEFTWVVSNYSTLAPLQTGRRKVEEFTVLDIDGVKIGVVGMNTEDTPHITPVGSLVFGASGRKSITISPSVSPVNRRIAQARAAGAEVVIAALHQGWQSNVNGAPIGRLVDVTRGLRGADIAFGGHTHQTFSSIVGDTPVAQTRNSGQEYTRTQLCLDRRSGRVVGAATQVVTGELLAGLVPDTETAAMVQGYRDQASAKLDVRIGVVDGIFPRGGIPPVERSGETALGDYVADALRVRYGTDLVILGGGGIRDTFPAYGYKPVDPSLRRPGGGSSGPYDVTLGDALSVFPFNNSVMTTQVTGRNLWTALENGVSGYPASGRFPQISGFRFTFDPTLPVGQRVISVTTTDGRAIASDDTPYSLATTDYLVSGGDDYQGLFSPNIAVVRDILADVFADAVMSESTTNGMVRIPALDGRITRVE